VRVDDGNLVDALYVDQDPVILGVVADVAGYSAQRNCSEAFAGESVHDCLAAARLVADPDLPGAWYLDQPVRIVAGSCSEHFGAGVLIEGDELVATSGCDKDSMQRRHDNQTVHVTEPSGDADHLAAGSVDREESAGAELRQKQPVGIRVDVGVGEAARGRRQFHRGHCP
jgi:hypothetical protein